jgi:extracellular elastinolytic metalloproteinase
VERGSRYDLLAHNTDIQTSPWSVDDPTSGKREAVTDPWDSDSSEFTWQSDGEHNYTTTQGNNAMAVQDYSGETTNMYQPTSPKLDFEYDLHLNESDPNAYRDASLTQLFYTANFYHDVLYDLGFNEEAGNFQVNNNGKGGKDNDAVILSAQDTYTTNNALVSIESLSNHNYVVEASSQNTLIDYTQSVNN